MIEETIKNLRKINEPVPKPLQLPSASEVDAAEATLGIKFHPDYRTYLLTASDVVYGTLEPCTVQRDGYYTDIVRVASTAWEQMGLPKNLLPICEDNGDYYCMNDKGEVEFWSHEGTTNEKWPSLSAWIEQVWIGEN